MQEAAGRSGGGSWAEAPGAADPGAGPGRRAGAGALGEPTMTVADLLWAWLASLEGRRRPSTLATHRGYVTNRLVPRLGALRLGELRAFHLDAAYGAWLVEDHLPLDQQVHVEDQAVHGLVDRT
ncbi:hypothetical protein ACFFRE_12050, partial [Aciditerrimonas ferrireducens]